MSKREGGREQGTKDRKVSSIYGMKFLPVDVTI